MPRGKLYDMGIDAHHSLHYLCGFHHGGKLVKMMAFS
jgi:hypothetical protein